MSNELTHSENNTLFSFVNSVADMEVRKYTLTESAKQAKEKAKKQKDQTESALKYAEATLERTQKNMQWSQDHLDEIDTYRKYRKETRTASRSWGEFFTFFFVYGIIAGGSSPQLSALFGMLLFDVPYEEFYTGFIVPLLILDLAIYYAIFRHYRYGEYMEEYNKRKAELRDDKEKYNQAQERFNLAKEAYDEAKKTVPSLIKKAEELENSAETIQNNLTQCYAMNIIPPSYQNLICVVLMNDVFVNNKADSIREAILLCDVETRHAEIVNKLSDINHSLQSLALSIHSMNSLLQDINANIDSISNDVSSISQNQCDIAYAVESVKKSSDNTDFYIAQKRTGAL